MRRCATWLQRTDHPAVVRARPVEVLRVGPRWATVLVEAGTWGTPRLARRAVLVGELVGHCEADPPWVGWAHDHPPAAEQMGLWR